MICCVFIPAIRVELLVGYRNQVNSHIRFILMNKCISMRWYYLGVVYISAVPAMLQTPSVVTNKQSSMVLITLFWISKNNNIFKNIWLVLILNNTVVNTNMLRKNSKYLFNTMLIMSVLERIISSNAWYLKTSNNIIIWIHSNVF